MRGLLRQNTHKSTKDLFRFFLASHRIFLKVNSSTQNGWLLVCFGVRRKMQGFVPCDDDKPQNTRKPPFRADSSVFVVVILVSELFSAFCSSASKHLPAVSSRHSFTETVFHFTMSFFRLIGTKHISVLLSLTGQITVLKKTLYLAKMYYRTLLYKKSSFFYFFYISVTFYKFTGANPIFFTFSFR